MTTLDNHLHGWADGIQPRQQVAATVAALAAGATDVARLLAAGPDIAAGEDVVPATERQAEAALVAALQPAAVAWIASDFAAAPVAGRAGAPLAVAIDPLDGSSNIVTDGACGTVFSVLPMPEPGQAGEPAANGLPAFLQQGARQLAAGFVLHGAHTALVLTLGQGTHLFVLDRAAGVFRLAQQGLQVPLARSLYAVNAANYRYWDTPVRSYVDDCIAGEDGPRGVDFNMRWTGCATAEAMRILRRGGVYLYPGDSRAGYRRGRLRLVFAANPLAFLFEQAGGGASNGIDPILRLVPQSLHQRVPLVFGSRDKVDRVAGYFTGRLPAGEYSPLFSKRGLFRV